MFNHGFTCISPKQKYILRVTTTYVVRAFCFFQVTQAMKKIGCWVLRRFCIKTSTKITELIYRNHIQYLKQWPSRCTKEAFSGKGSRLFKHYLGVSYVCFSFSTPRQKQQFESGALQSIILTFCDSTQRNLHNTPSTVHNLFRYFTSDFISVVTITPTALIALSISITL